MHHFNQVLLTFTSCMIPSNQNPFFEKNLNMKKEIYFFVIVEDMVWNKMRWGFKIHN